MTPGAFAEHLRERADWWRAAISKDHKSCDCARLSDRLLSLADKVTADNLDIVRDAFEATEAVALLVLESRDESLYEAEKQLNARSKKTGAVIKKYQPARAQLWEYVYRHPESTDDGILLDRFQRECAEAMPQRRSEITNNWLPFIRTEVAMALYLQKHMRSSDAKRIAQEAIDHAAIRLA